MEMPLLSVCLITYNHERYIRQAVESVLKQQVDFAWEFIIADDCSTDNTRAILLEYQAQNPDLIRLILQEKNVGPAQNWLDLITAPKSKYIAYFEGDDYWIDDTKLQQQVDFLEQNPEFILSHSNVEIIDANDTVVHNHHLKRWNQLSQRLDYRLAIFNPIAFSCTAVFRNSLPIKKMSTKVKAGDWMLWVLLTLQGDAQFINQKLSAYRLGSGISVTSVWHRDFHYRAFFLLNQMGFKKTLKANTWLFKGVLFFSLYQLSKILNRRVFSKMAEAIQYKVACE